MFSRLQAVAVVAAVTWSAFGLYWVLLVPIVEPPAAGPGNNRVTQEEVDKAREEQISRNRERFKDLFRPGDWELESPKVIESDSFVLLLKEYKPLPDGQIQLQPCTLILFPSGRPADGERLTGRAIVMQAPEGAVLQFDEQLDLRRGKIGQLVGGKLSGQVTIHARESQPGAGDELEIVTKNVQMNSERIWTPHELDFRYGQSHGSGRDLQILLSTVRDPADVDADKPKMPGGLKSIELVHVDKVYIQTGGKPLARSTVDPMPTGPMSVFSGSSELPVEITCRGPFLFDLERRVASFDDQVDVVRLHPTGPSDQLSCRTLELHFGEAEPKIEAAPLAPAADAASKKDEKKTATAAKPVPEKRVLPALNVERVRAMGAPVVLRSPAYLAEVRGDVVEYDLRTNTIRLDSETKVSLKQAEHDVEAKRLEYTLDENGGIGRMWAQGPGFFQRRALVAGQAEFTARWQHQLLLRPHDGMHVLSLTKDASLILTGAGKLNAGEIHLWLRPQPKSERPVAALGAPKQPGFSPDRLLAKEKVFFESAKLVANTNQLEVWIKDRPHSPIAMVGAEEPIAGAGGFVPGANPAASPQQFTLVAGMLRLLVVRAGTLTQLEDVTAEGDVQLIESVTAVAGELPIVISGQRMQLFHASSLDATLGVFGQPAELRGRGFSLTGERIRAHRGQARMWIDGPGRMVLPASMPGGQTSLLPTGVAARPAAPTAQRTTFNVDWRGSLDFNGRTLSCQGGVSVRGEGQQATCEILTAALERPLDLSRLEPPRDVQMRQVSLQRNVALENRAADPQGLISIDRLQLHELTVDQKTGEIHGTGPGWMTSVRHGGKSSFPGANGARDPARAANPGSGLNYMRIDFQQGLAGNVGRRELRFLQQVKGVVGPVADWNATLEPQSALASGEAALLSCDQLLVRQVVLPGAPKPTAEMEATGNTIVEGKQFTARCNRLSYTEAKDLLVIEGDGRADAELVRREVAGGPDSRAKAGKILFWRTDNRVLVEDAQLLDLTQFAQPRNAQQPKPPVVPGPPINPMR